MKINDDHEKRINRAVNFINANPAENLSLERLASIASYSPFHFQRLFRSIVGEAPNQYVRRIRLETAAHEMVMFQHRSITDIALANGFSSSAVFSRAFKAYFGITPQELKRIPHEERFKMFRQGKLGRHMLDTDRYFSKDDDSFASINVRVVRSEPVRGIFVGASLDDEEGITNAFKMVATLARVHDLIDDTARFAGMLYPHQRLYQALAIVDPKRNVPPRLDMKEIVAGKFGVITVSGGVEKTFAALKAFSNNWLPDSGYRIADVSGYETFLTDPTSSPYSAMTRDIFIRIEPAS